MSGAKKDNGKMLFGGFNFIIVLWTLLTIFNLSVTVKNYPLMELLQFDLLTYVVPMIFLAVLNVLIGVSLFMPNKKSSMWLLSVIILTATLVTLNSFESKLTGFKDSKSADDSVVTF